METHTKRAFENSTSDTAVHARLQIKSKLIEKPFQRLNPDLFCCSFELKQVSIQTGSNDLNNSQKYRDAGRS